MWAGHAKGVSGIFIDERADDLQTEALQEIFSGRAGGWPEQWASLFPEGREIRGVERANISFEIAPDLEHWGMEILDKVTSWAKAITGPTSPPGTLPQLMNAPGAETGPNPKLATNSSKHIPFDWIGP